MLMRSEGFAPSLPAFTASWRQQNNNAVLIEIGDVRRNASLAREYELRDDVEVSNVMSKNLEKLGARVGAYGMYGLGADLSTTRGPLRIRMDFGLSDGPKNFSPARTTSNGRPLYRAWARDGSIALVSRVADIILGSLNRPDWFEVMQGKDSRWAALGLSRQGPADKPGWKRTPVWLNDGIRYELAKIPVADAKRVLAQIGGTAVNSNAIMSRVDNPELEKSGLKTYLNVGPTVGFVSGDSILVFRQTSENNRQWPTDFPDKRGSALYRPRMENDFMRLESGALKRFNRLVLAIRKLSGQTVNRSLVGR